MNAKNLLFEQEARDKLIAGVDKLANAVKETMGPRGRNVVIERAFGAPSITKDGVSVAKEVDLKDPFENLGAQMMKDVASKTGDEAGDGTTTATVLAQALVRNGIKNITAGSSAVQLKRGIDEACKRIVSNLRDSAVPIKGTEEIAQVGAISANNEREIGDLLAEAMDSVGKDGVISVEDSSDSETTLELKDGFELDKGYLSKHFLTKESESTSISFEKAAIAIICGDVTNAKTILGLLEKCHKLEMPLVIIAHSYSDAVHKFLLENVYQVSVKVVPVIAPQFGDLRDSILEDIAIATGGRVIGPRSEVKLEEAGVEDLGACQSIAISKSTTTIIEGDGQEVEITGRMDSLRSQSEKTESEFDKEKLQKRIARLSGGVAVIRVGGNSEVELKEKKDRVEDALHATRAAVLGGIVEGGGTALLKASNKIDISDLEGDIKTGAELLIKTAQAPIAQILYNAGHKPDAVINDILSGREKGFNAHTGKYEDLFISGVIDPVNVTIAAITNASSIAGMLLTTSCAITIDRDDQTVITH